MLWYTKTASNYRAYDDAETNAWDHARGKLREDTFVARKAKIDAIEIAYDEEKVKGEVDPKAPPQKIIDKELELKTALVAETATHEVKKCDETLNREVADDLTEPVYQCSWDGSAPYVTTLVGTFPEEGIPFMGWPQTDVPPEVSPIVLPPEGSLIVSPPTEEL